jgi:hypothetical protein
MNTDLLWLTVFGILIGIVVGCIGTYKSIVHAKTITHAKFMVFATAGIFSFALAFLMIAILIPILSLLFSPLPLWFVIWRLQQAEKINLEFEAKRKSINNDAQAIQPSP